MKPTVETVESLKFAINNESERRGLPRRGPAEVLEWIEQDCYGWLVHEVNVAEQVETLLGIVVVPDADTRKDSTCPTQVAEARWPGKSLMVTKWTHRDLKAEDRRDAMQIEMARENPLTPFGFNPETFAPLPPPLPYTPGGEAAFHGVLSTFTYDMPASPFSPAGDSASHRYLIILLSQLTDYFLPIYPLLVCRPGLLPLPLFFYPLPAPGIIVQQSSVRAKEMDTFAGLIELLNAEITRRIQGNVFLADILQSDAEFQASPRKPYQILVHVSTPVATEYLPTGHVMLTLCNMGRPGLNGDDGNPYVLEVGEQPIVDEENRPSLLKGQRFVIERHAERDQVKVHELNEFGGEVNAIFVKAHQSAILVGRYRDVYPLRRCNIHDDCDAADARAEETGKRIPDHCTDPECEQCSGG